MFELRSKRYLSKRAQEYFGGDVQRFAMYRKEIGHYVIMQTPHYGNPRIIARTFAGSALNAVRDFNAMADIAKINGEQYA